MEITDYDLSCAHETIWMQRENGQTCQIETPSFFDWYAQIYTDTEDGTVLFNDPENGIIISTVRENNYRAESKTYTDFLKRFSVNLTDLFTRYTQCAEDITWESVELSEVA